MLLNHGSIQSGPRQGTSTGIEYAVERRGRRNREIVRMTEITEPKLASASPRSYDDFDKSSNHRRSYLSQ